MQHFWTRKDLYYVSLDRSRKRFYVDFISNTRSRNGRVNVFYDLEFLTFWFTRNDSVLIALKDRDYLYISDRIVQFKMDEGDMVVRFLPSSGNTASALLTRFNTIYFNENADMYYLIDRTTSRPPELHVGFKVDDEFNAKYAMLYHYHLSMHNGDALQNFIRNAQ